ncbi:MAG: hypothetical protein IJI21_00360, partial [Clostridia bacterium]|nr:hypothetical protein [Clostridia bacterium]
MTITIYDGETNQVLPSGDSGAINVGTFTNTKIEEKISGKKHLYATKSINDWGNAESFEFTLAPVDGAPMPEGVNDEGNIVKNATKTVPTVDFGEIEYTAEGIYEYTITETDDGV